MFCLLVVKLDIQKDDILLHEKNESHANMPFRSYSWMLQLMQGIPGVNPGQSNDTCSVLTNTNQTTDLSHEVLVSNVFVIIVCSSYIVLKSGIFHFF